jgi:hypothetical protein
MNVIDASVATNPKAAFCDQANCVRRTPATRPITSPTAAPMLSPMLNYTRRGTLKIQGVRIRRRPFACVIRDLVPAIFGKRSLLEQVAQIVAQRWRRSKQISREETPTANRRRKPLWSRRSQRKEYQQKPPCYPHQKNGHQAREGKRTKLGGRAVSRQRRRDCMRFPCQLRTNDLCRTDGHNWHQG